MRTLLVKELSQIMNVSIRTLHFYDKIGLLKPSARLPNGYRMYSEADIIKLKQIIALKFFGFTLSHIKTLLERNESETLDMLKTQFKLLQAEVAQIQGAQTALLAEAIENLEKNKEVNWDTTVALIEVFSKTTDLKKKSSELFNFKESSKLSDTQNL